MVPLILITNQDLVSTSYQTSYQTMSRTIRHPTMIHQIHHWSPYENAVLKDLTKKYVVSTTLDWKFITDKLNHRIGSSWHHTQCREIFVNHLNGISKGPFTPKEILKLLLLTKRMGHNWTPMAKHFPGRSASQLKNNWHALQRRKLTAEFKLGSSKKNAQTLSATKVPFLHHMGINKPSSSRKAEDPQPSAGLMMLAKIASSRYEKFANK